MSETRFNPGDRIRYGNLGEGFFMKYINPGYCRWESDEGFIWDTMESYLSSAEETEYRFQPGDRVALPCGRCIGQVLKVQTTGSIYAGRISQVCLVKLIYLNSELWLDKRYLSLVEEPQ